MKSIDDVRNEMNETYASGRAYCTDLPFDIVRGHSIRNATMTLARLAVRDLTDVRVLDVGSGEGGIASFWPFPNNVTGLEISQVAVERARSTFPAATYRCGAIEEFTLGEGEQPYPMVVAQETIEHWTNSVKGMRAIYQCMPVTGHLVITTPNRDSLHCRMSRKLGLGEPPLCSYDHIHEFGYYELIDLVQDIGFRRLHSLGVGLMPYWTMERMFGTTVRHLTDKDPTVVRWFEDMGAQVDPQYAFIQCHLFKKDPPEKVTLHD